MHLFVVFLKIYQLSIEYAVLYGLHPNPLARSPQKVKLDSDKWNLERICLNKLIDFFVNLAYSQVGEKN